MTSAVGNQLLTKIGTFSKNLALENYYTLKTRTRFAPNQKTKTTKPVCVCMVGTYTSIGSIYEVMRKTTGNNNTNQRVKEFFSYYDGMVLYLVVALVYYYCARVMTLCFVHLRFFFLIQYYIGFALVLNDSTSILYGSEYEVPISFTNICPEQVYMER